MSSSEPGNQSTTSADEAKPGKAASTSAAVDSQAAAASHVEETTADVAAARAPDSAAAPAASTVHERQAEKASTAQPSGKALRAGYFAGVFAAFKHINESISSEGRKLRATDYISVILLPLAALLLAYCCGAPQGADVRPYLVLLFNVTALYFIGARIGVIRTLSKRQTHLIWSIMCACFFLGLTFALLLYDFVRAITAPAVPY